MCLAQREEALSSPASNLPARFHWAWKASGLSGDSVVFQTSSHSCGQITTTINSVVIIIIVVIIINIVVIVTTTIIIIIIVIIINSVVIIIIIIIIIIIVVVINIVCYTDLTPHRRNFPLARQLARLPVLIISVRGFLMHKLRPWLGLTTAE